MDKMAAISQTILSDAFSSMEALYLIKIPIDNKPVLI